MAGGSLYQDDDDAGGITDINVTPFVDVLLVLLVVFIVTAKLIVARGIEVDKPKAATGGEVQSTLQISVKQPAKGPAELYVNGVRFADDASAVARIKAIAATTSAPRAIIAGDKTTAYDNVMHAIDLAQQAGVTAIALENVHP